VGQIEKCTVISECVGVFSHVSSLSYLNRREISCDWHLSNNNRYRRTKVMSQQIDQAVKVFNQLCSEVDITEKSFQSMCQNHVILTVTNNRKVALASICFNPIFWNVVARLGMTPL
jgi:hypothetical protein